MNHDEWRAALAQRRAEEAIIRDAFVLRAPSGDEVRRGLTASYYAPPDPTAFPPIPGGKLEAWYLGLLDGPLAGTRVRLPREADPDDHAPQLSRRDRRRHAPYGTCYGSAVVPGDVWYFVDHLTDGGGPRWRREHYVVPADAFALSEHPDPVEPAGWTCPRDERERRWRVAWEQARRTAEVRASLSPPLACDACGHVARAAPGSPCPKCRAYYGSANDSAVGRMVAEKRAVCPHCRKSVRLRHDQSLLVPHDIDGLEPNGPGSFDGANPEGVGHVRCEGTWAPVR